MAAFVLDASVAIAGLAPDEGNRACEALLDQAFVRAVAAPALWYIEVANISLVKLRRGLLLPEEHRAILTDMANLRVECDTEFLFRQCEAASALALHHKLSAYDAAYLELALRLKIPLATLDRALARAAREAGAEVLP